MSRHVSKQRLIRRAVYLYTFHSECGMRVYKGNVYVDHNVVKPSYFFKSNEKKPYIVNCSSEPGTFRINNIWLRELDKEKAVDIYHDYVNKITEEKFKTIHRLRQTFLMSLIGHMEDHTEGQEWMQKLSSLPKTQS